MARLVDHFQAHESVARASVAELGAIAEVVSAAFVRCLKDGRKVMAFGNGGSATQASHLAGELIGQFSRKRRALPALALMADAGAVTCIANDFGYGALFERQVEGLGVAGDLVVGLTTSGKSENVLRGLAAAQRLGAVTVALTGEAGLSNGTVDHLVKVPSKATAHIQEVHLMLLHYWCEAVDAAFP